jgi:hypothetical protein
MADLLKLLKEFLPVEIAIISCIFIYLLLIFKRIAEKFITLNEKQASLAQDQAKYIHERLEVVERTLGISDKAYDLQEKRIKALEEVESKREKELASSRTALESARENLKRMEKQYKDALKQLDLQKQQVLELDSAQEQLQSANRNEAIAEFSYRIQARLQRVLAHADNLKHELPDGSLFGINLEEILTEIENIGVEVHSFSGGEYHVKSGG